MSGQTAKIINLEDYILARAPLQMNEIKGILAQIQTNLRTLEEDVSGIILGEHKVKDIEPKKNIAFKHEVVLKRIGYFLKDNIAANETITRNELQNDLLKQCETLKKEAEEIKKTITEEIKTCRDKEKEEAIDWMRVAGFLIGTPLAVPKFVETFLSDRPEIVTTSGEVGVILGAYLAFHRQANAIGVKAIKAAIQLPKRTRPARISVRNAAFGITMNASVSAISRNEVQAHEPARLADRPKTVIAGQKLSESTLRF